MKWNSRLFAFTALATSLCTAVIGYNIGGKSVKSKISAHNQNRSTTRTIRERQRGVRERQRDDLKSINFFFEEAKIATRNSLKKSEFVSLSISRPSKGDFFKEAKKTTKIPENIRDSITEIIGTNTYGKEGALLSHWLDQDPRKVAEFIQQQKGGVSKEAMEGAVSLYFSEHGSEKFRKLIGLGAELDSFLSRVFPMESPYEAFNSRESFTDPKLRRKVVERAFKNWPLEDKARALTQMGANLGDIEYTLASLAIGARLSGNDLIQWTEECSTMEGTTDKAKAALKRTSLYKYAYIKAGDLSFDERLNGTARRIGYQGEIQESEREKIAKKIIKNDIGKYVKNNEDLMIGFKAGYYYAADIYAAVSESNSAAATDYHRLLAVELFKQTALSNPKEGLKFLESTSVKQSQRAILDLAEKGARRASDFDRVIELVTLLPHNLDRATETELRKILQQGLQSNISSQGEHIISKWINKLDDSRIKEILANGMQTEKKKRKLNL